MSRLFLASLLSGLVIAVAGCGGGDGASSRADASQPETLLLTAAELPDGSTSGEIAPELCGPLPILQKSGGQAAISKTFVVDEAKVVEAVGVFETPADAKAAFAELNTRERFECIANAVQTLGGAASVRAAPPKSSGVGDDDTVMRFVAFDDATADGGEPEPNGFSDIVTVRVGRCVASLLIGVESGEPPDAVSDETVETVADRLSGACE